MKQLTLSSFFIRDAQLKIKTENRFSGQIKLWITHLRDLEMANICKTRIWYKSRNIYETPQKDWSKWTIAHNSQLETILDNLPKNLPSKLRNLVSNEPLTITKNYPIEMEVTDRILIIGKLDVFMTTSKQDSAVVIEIKGNNEITPSNIVQTKLYMISLHFMYPTRKIFGVICNKKRSKLIEMDKIDINSELTRIKNRVSFLYNLSPPKPEYIFTYDGKVCCEACGYLNCNYRRRSNEFF